MKCVLIFGLFALFLIQATLADDVAVEPPCTDGDSKKDDLDCNNCYCTNGKWACTRMQCNGPKLTIKNEQSLDAPCENGKTRLDDEECNTCTCNNNVWACTEKLCPPKSR